ncbi:TM0106 family RecB-like putative nuclease [Glutamicibacter endophyticus]|uniref:TM0106 family RecB-like putative nuclease n=1 Tax=Glutamicibacter endophyticus TaxID=1522174 RepID=UPI003AF00020
MFFQGQNFIYSPSDISVAVGCEYQCLYLLDVKLGRRAKPDFATDEMLERTAVLGDAHEQRVLARLRERFGAYDPATATGVKEFADRPQMSESALRAAHEATMEVLRSGADVVFQATFFDGHMVGFADFLVRQPDGSWAVWDTKLARHARVSALLQLAAYADQLQAEGIAVHPVASLVLGDDSTSEHRIAEILPVFHAQRRHFLDLVRAHREADRQVPWDGDSLRVCGRCDFCAEQVAEHRDLLLVAGMSLAQRATLRKEGIFTIDELAQATATAGSSRARYVEQAQMQLGTIEYDGAVDQVRYKLKSTESIKRLPQPDAGDIFFDFEGDPMYQDPHDLSWGLEYLFGVIEYDTGEPVFRPFWAHNRAEERVAFLDFVEYVNERRRRFPQMHVYHYAPYEKTALRKLSQIHVSAEDDIDQWLRDGLLVDLYETVRQSLLVSARSYSIKKLEPLYMGEHLRSGEVTDAGASVVAYAHYSDALANGDSIRAQHILDSIADYNEYDCLSTLRLRDWLLDLIGGPENCRGPRAIEEPLPNSEAEPSPEEQRLHEYLNALPASHQFSDDERAIAMVAAATGYHRRERKQYWWEHFDRLSAPLDDWSEQRGVFTVSSAQVLEDWHKETERARTFTRITRLRGTLAEGSLVAPGSAFFAMFASPLPEGMENETAERGGAFNTTVLSIGKGYLEVKEKSSAKIPTYGAFPLALTPPSPIATKSIEAALSEIAQTVGATVPELPRNAALDLLRRLPPRFKSLSEPPTPAVVDELPQVYPAVLTAVRDLDHSYLAVQGPPGTGKTFVASHVIKELVLEGWKVGVVAQSHAVVENVLIKTIAAGLPQDLVAKEVPAERNVPWQARTKKDVAALLAADGGGLIGGTAWTLTGSSVPRASLDLLVIDEAGQFSLANTLAVAVAARNLLLLGDPQQLPQVTQGSHPQPVDESALGWLSAGHPTLPPHLGYFLANSWRMHPELCSKVSALSYDRQLGSTPAAAARTLRGPSAGVQTRLVPHRGNTTSSPEEAAAIVEMVQEHLGLAWAADESQETRPLAEEDILVVAAYNAQVNLLRETLQAHGLAGVKVGTVDKFQGQEAPVVLVSMACSSAEDAARGIDFLLNRNRINVAISRGQWRAVIVRSPDLTNFLPTSIPALEQLGAFLNLS